MLTVYQWKCHKYTNGLLRGTIKDNRLKQKFLLAIIIDYVSIINGEEIRQKVNKLIIVLTL